RNAFLVPISGRDVKVDQILDWYRPDESGRPMPAEWRDLVGQIHVPLLAKPNASLCSGRHRDACLASRHREEPRTVPINLDRGEETNISLDHSTGLIHVFVAYTSSSMHYDHGG